MKLNQILLIFKDEININKEEIINFILTFNKRMKLIDFKHHLILFCLKNITNTLLNICFLINIETSMEIIPSNLLFNINYIKPINIHVLDIEMKNIKHNINHSEILNLIEKMIEYSNINQNYTDLILIDKNNYIIDGKYNYIKSCLFNVKTRVYKSDDYELEIQNRNPSNTNETISKLSPEILEQNLLNIEHSNKDKMNKDKIYNILNQFTSFDLFIKNNRIVQEWVRGVEINTNNTIKLFIIKNLIENGLIIDELYYV